MYAGERLADTVIVCGRSDLVFQPEERIVVRKQSGTLEGAAQLLLENTHLDLLNPEGATCVSACRSGACPAGVAHSDACPGVNRLKTLNDEEAADNEYGEAGSLSISDTLYLHPETISVRQPSVCGSRVWQV